MKRNTQLAAQNMPPEFKFQPTRMYYNAPPSKIIYEDAMGSSGKSPMDPRLQAILDPIHWAAGRGGEQNFEKTSRGVIAHLTQQFRHSQTPITRIRKHDRPQNINRIIEEAPGARRPRVRGYRTPEEVARGAKAKQPSVKPQPDLDKMAMLLDPRRGFRVGSRRSYAKFLSTLKKETVDSMAAPMMKRIEQENAPRVRIGGSEYTKNQLQSLPPGYVRTLIERQKRRAASQAKPQVMFDPKESKGMSSDGQYTTLEKPGLIEIEEGKWVKPEQLGMAAASIDEGIEVTNMQPKSSKWRGAAAIGLLLVGTIVGIAIIRS